MVFLARQIPRRIPMGFRKTLLAALFTLLSLAFSVRVFAQASWAVDRTFHVGGAGGWDYVTVDEKNHRLYVPRSTHTMVSDAKTGQTLADIPGQKNNHRDALVSEVGRGFIMNDRSPLPILYLNTNPSSR